MECNNHFVTYLGNILFIPVTGRSCMHPFDRQIDVPAEVMQMEVSKGPTTLAQLRQTHGKYIDAVFTVLAVSSIFTIRAIPVKTQGGNETNKSGGEYTLFAQQGVVGVYKIHLQGKGTSDHLSKNSSPTTTNPTKNKSMQYPLCCQTHEKCMPATTYMLYFAQGLL